MTLLEVEGVWAGYAGVMALRDVSLTVDEGERVIIIGSNGAGKSTLLKTIVGEVRSARGAIRFEGRDLTHISPERALRAGIALVPEGRRVFPDLTVRENLELGGYLLRREPARLRARIARALEAFPILEERARQRAGTLSGGEQQMLAIARALVPEPRLLLLDEPSLGLAPRVCRDLFERLAGLPATGVSILLVEQLAYLGLGLADRGYLLENGSVALAGAAAALRSDVKVREVYLGAQAAR